MDNKLTFRKLSRWVWTYASGVRAKLAIATLAGAARVAASLTFVWVSKNLVDAATLQSNADTSLMIKLALVLVGLFILELCLTLFSSYLTDKSEIQLKNKLRALAYSHALRTQSHVGEQRHSGDMVNRLVEDTRVISEAVCQSIPEILVMVIQLFGALWMLYVLSPILSLCIAVILPICLVLSKIYLKVMRRLTLGIRALEGEIHTSIQEGLQHTVVVKAMHCADWLVQLLGGVQSTLQEETLRRTRFNLFSRAMIRIGFMAGFLTTFIWSAWNIHTGLITYGTMTAFMQLVGRVQHPMAQLARYVPIVAHAYASAERLYEIEEEPIEDDKNGAILPGPLGVRIQNLHFKYAADGPQVINSLSCDFAPGSITAIMGTTGIGKTTLIRLLLALLKPEKGSISLYGKGVEKHADVETRCNFAYVPQGNTLFYDTVRNNLLIANANATDAEMKQALIDAEAQFVLDFPNGIDTVCGERGARLSEGQAQRIAIARALLCRGNVLLLDEYDSALDAVTAKNIMERLVKTGRTIIFITHRIDLAEYCTSILKL